MILSINMEKCFDRLEHRALFESLKYFNFGDQFVQWAKLFYTGFSICTQNFGVLSPFWVKGWGVNQGCPLSLGLYLLMAEIMANKLRDDNKFKGVKMGNVEYLISQLADDTDLYLAFDQTTLSNTLQVLTDIETNTGLQVSYEKTTIYRIGPMANTQAKLYTTRRVNWSNEFVNTLGVDLFNDPQLREVNITQIINKMELVSKMWYFRNMTLTGKVLVVNSLMASLFVYKMQVLPPVGDHLVQQIEKIIVKNQIIWLNLMIKINDKTLPFSPSNGSLLTVGHLWDNNRFKTYLEAKNEFSLTMSWYRYCSIISAIPDMWKYFLKMKDLVDNHMEKFDFIMRVTGISKVVYPDMIWTDNILSHICATWNKKLNCAVDINEAQNYFKNVKFISKKVNSEIFNTG